ncbi:MAG: TIR domain-containing protein [Ignavibacteriota bacterium]
MWIDQHGIVGAEKWATEIVEGINSCSTFLLLISPHSIESENVLRELSLASEKRKRVLPVELERVPLPSSFEYPLAGIQHVKIADFDAILHAHKHGVSKVVVKDTRKSLIILPFEDLSPAKDNQWFADGLAGEMIEAFSRIKSLRILDRKSSMDLRGVKQTSKEIAKLFDTRFIVEGTIAKIGERIKISASLLDTETNEHLWQDSYKGVMDDIFELQESVAEQIVTGLKLHLTKEEKSLLAERGTENTEAYELYLKSIEYFDRKNRDGFHIAIELLTHALMLDPNYAHALQHKAHVLTALYRSYDRNPKHLEESESLVKQALEIKPDLWIAYHALSLSNLLQGRITDAEETALELVRRAPENYFSHSALGLIYSQIKQPAKAIKHYEKCLELKPDYLIVYFNLVVLSDQAHDEERVRKWSIAALPFFQRRLSLVPDDENARVNFANLLLYSKQPKRALLALEPLLKKQDLDGATCYNIACLYAPLGDTANALSMLRRSVGAGFSNVEIFRRDPDLDPLRGTLEFAELVKKVESGT